MTIHLCTDGHTAITDCCHKSVYDLPRGDALVGFLSERVRVTCPELQRPLTVRLNDGREVLAKVYKDEPFAKTYANIGQAELAAERLGDGWKVTGHRPYYVTRIKGAYHCPICGRDNAFVNQCGCDKNNLPTSVFAVDLASVARRQGQANETKPDTLRSRPPSRRA